MLSIDEAIAREREMAEMHRNDIVPKEKYHNISWVDKNNEASMRSAEEHEQLAEWLEELKTYRECNVCEYNKAIDDFSKLIKQRKFDYIEKCVGFDSFVDEIAERLKAGGENE